MKSDLDWQLGQTLDMPYRDGLLYTSLKPSILPIQHIIILKGVSFSFKCNWNAESCLEELAIRC